MSALRRDLLERRLWPLAVVLVLAVIAVPLLALEHPSASGAAAPVPPHVSLPGLPTATVAAAQPDPALVMGTPRNPFAAGTPKHSSAPAAPLSPTTTASSTNAAATTAASSTRTASSTTATTVTPTPATTTTASLTADQSGPTSSTSSQKSASTTTSTASSTTKAQSASSTQSWTIYAVDVRAGTSATARVRDNVQRLTPLPSAKQPVAMFMGVLAGGKQAAFALASAVRLSGPGVCHPHKWMCAEIVLSASQTERITMSSAGSKTQAQLVLRLVAVSSSVTHSQSTALAAYERHSAAGQCDLDLAQPMSYNQSEGTLSAAAGAACQHQTAQVPFPSAPPSQ